MAPNARHSANQDSADAWPRCSRAAMALQHRQRGEFNPVNIVDKPPSSCEFAPYVGQL